MKNNREMFMEWLNGRASSYNIRDYCEVFPKIEVYAKSKKIISGSIFDIDDPAIIETISQRLSNDRAFGFWHKKKIKTMTEVLDYLSDEYGWSRSVPNLSGKLKRGSLRYGETVELADALGYDIVWKK